MFKPLIAAALLAAGASAARAATTVDQSILAVGSPGVSIVYSNLGHTQPTPGQFFDVTDLQFVTAGKTGLLAGIDLQLTRNPAASFGQLTLLVARNVAIDGGGHPSGTILGAIDVNISALPASGGGPLFSIDTRSLGASFTAGEQFAFALSGAESNPGVFGWAFATRATAPGSPLNFLAYPGGAAYRSVTPTGQEGENPFLLQGADFGFRTLVDDGVAPVPEPGEWAMMLAGLGLVGAVTRRRRVSAA